MTSVYLHPVGLDHEVWDQVAPPGTLALDLPGFGITPPVEHLDFDVMIEYVASKLDGPATLIGCSLGSMLAQQMAVRRPELVESLVLACGGVSTGAALHERAAATRAGGMEGMLPSTLERWFTDEALATPDHPGVAYVTRRLLSDSAEVFAQYWDAMAAHDLREQIGAVSVPTTVIAGDRDKAASVDTMSQLASLIPGAKLVVLEGPHMLPLENPQGFARAVEEHLKGASL